MHAVAHDHSGHHPSQASESRLLLAAALTIATMLAEAVGGWISGSLALFSDAAHMLVDAFALLLAWAGAHFARRPADDRRSFGYARLEVLAGYSNSILQLFLVVWIAVEAVSRLMRPEPILSGIMLGVALVGLVVNLIVLGALGSHQHDDLNVAGARLHVLGDLLGSAGAVAAALLVRYSGWLQADPLVSLLVSALILGSAWNLLRRSAHILLEGVPDGIETAHVAETVRRESGIRLSLDWRAIPRERLTSEADEQIRSRATYVDTERFLAGGSTLVFTDGDPLDAFIRRARGETVGQAHIEVVPLGPT